MSYFAAAIVWLLGAEGLMLAGFGFPATDLASPDTLVLVHMITIGWLSMAMCGALFQFVPVLVGKPLFAERWALPAFGFLTIGLVALLAGFLALGGRLPSWLWLLPLGAVFLIVGFALVGIDLGLTVWRAPRWDAAARLVLVGLLSMGATVAFGGTFAFELGGWAKSAPAALAILNDGVPLHAIAGLGGWLTLTAMGVSYRLLSMFMLSPDVDDRKTRMTVFAGAGTIAIALAGGLAAIAASAGLSIVLSLAGISGLATLALYTRDLVKLYRNRKRGALELNTRMAVHSFACLAGAALLGVTLAAMGSFADHAGAFVFLVAFGWLSGLVLAKLYKIVAFLTWLETYGPVMGRVPTPRVQDLVAERRATKWFAAYFLAVWIATALLLGNQPFAFRVAALAMTVATIGIVQELIRTRRLADVVEPLRLPKGATAPRLLFSRS